MFRKLWTRMTRRQTQSTKAQTRRRRALYRQWSSLGAELLEDRSMLSALLTLNGPESIVVGANVNVSNNNATLESEMSIDINPTNPLNVVGFVHDIYNQTQPGTTNMAQNRIQVFYSTDGGTSWTRRFIDDGTSGIDDGMGFGKRFDPTIRFDADGNLFVGYGFQAGGKTSLIVGHSADGGNTFDRFRVVDTQNDGGNPGVDKWMLATGGDPSTGRQAVYVAYTQNAKDQRIAVAGSNDGGNTFTAPRTISDAPTGALFASPAVGSNGELYVAWHAYYGSGGGAVELDRDLDGLWWNGSDFGTDISIRSLTRNLNKTSVPAQPTRGIDNAPVLAVDSSRGPFRGRVYVTFVDGFGAPTPTSDTDVYLVWSDNQGAWGSWTTIAAGDPGNVEGGASTDFLPWVTVDKASGSVNLVYYTTDGAPSNAEVNVRLASSIDGGATFTKINLTSATSRADQASYSGEFLEYIGLAVLDGTAHAFWADNRGNVAGTYAADLDSYTAAAYLGGDNLLTIRGDDTAYADDTIVVRVSPNNTSFLEVLVNGRIQFAGQTNSVNHIRILPGAGRNTINIADLPVGVTLEVLSSARDTVNVGSNQAMGAILGSVRISNSLAGQTTVNVDDSADPFDVPDIVVDNDPVSNVGRIHGLGNGEVIFNRRDVEAVNVKTGAGRDVFTVSLTGGTFSTHIETGAGDDEVHVLATAGPLDITSSDGRDKVSLGSLSGSLTSIAGPVSVDADKGSIELALDDSGENQPRQVTFTDAAVLSPGFGTISYGPHVTSLAFQGGGSGNRFDILGTSQNAPITLHSGKGNDTINVHATTGVNSNTTAVNIDGDDGHDKLTIGSRAPLLNGSLMNIAAPIRVDSLKGTVEVIVDDSGDAQPREAVISDGLITGLAPAAISYGGHVTSLDVWGGSGGNRFDVLNTSENAPVALHSGINNDVINIRGTTSVNGSTTAVNVDGEAGSDVVTVGSLAPLLGGTLADIAAPIQVGSSGGSMALIVDDSGDLVRRNAIVTGGSVTGLAAAINFNQITSLVVNAGQGGNLIGVESTLPDTTINAGNGSDQIMVGDAQHSLAKINVLQINGGAGTTVKLDDEADQDLVDFDDGTSASWHATITTNRPTFDVASGEVTFTDRLTTKELTGGLGQPTRVLDATTDRHDSHIRYSNIAKLDITAATRQPLTDVGAVFNGSPAPNIFNVTSTADFSVAGTAGDTDVVINTGGGGDTVNVGAPDNLLSHVRLLTVNGGDGTVVNLDDQANDDFLGSIYNGWNTFTTTPQYVVTGEQVTRTDTVIETDPQTHQVVNQFPANTVVNYSNIAALNINGGASDDTFAIQGTHEGTPVTIDTGAGVNVVDVTADSQNMDDLQADITVHGGGQTTVTLNDGLVADHTTYHINAQSAIRLDPVAVNLSNVTALILNGAPSASYELEAPPTGAAVTINPGPGPNTFSPTSALLPGSGFTINLADTDLILDDSASTADTIYTITDTTLQIGDLPPLVYTGLAGLTVMGGSGNNVFNVEGTAAAIPVTIDAGDGSNVVNAGVPVNLLNNVPQLTVHGGAHTVLSLDDQANADFPGSIYAGWDTFTTNPTYVITDQAVTRENTVIETDPQTGQLVGTFHIANTVNYSNLAALNLNGGLSNDVFDIESTAAGTQTIIDSGGGSDLFNVSPQAQDLDGIEGPLALHGPASGTGSAALMVNDQNATASTYYTITASTISSTLPHGGQARPFTTISYDAMASLTLRGGSGSNVPWVQSTPAGLALSIFSGAGNDVTLFEVPGIRGPVFVDPQAGTNTTYLYDGPSAGNGRTYTITSTRVISSDGFSLSYPEPDETAGSAFGLFTYNDYDETINLESVTDRQSWALWAAGGNNTFNIGNPVTGLAAIRGRPLIDGSNYLGIDTVHINDQAETAGQTYDLDYDPTYSVYTVNRTGAAPIWYTGTVENLIVNGGSGGNDISVAATPADTSVSIKSGAGDDTVAILSTPGPVHIDGSGGTNTLDYSVFTGDIKVNLPLGLATAVTNGIANIQNVTGGRGNSLIVGDANANVLIGGSGRNVLIGGGGGDTLDASAAGSDNILIGGTTGFDTHVAALDAIFAEWTRTDLGFRDRFADLTTGTNGQNATPLNQVDGQLILLAPGTVHADSSPDTLIGSNQTDLATGKRAHNWFFFEDDVDVKDVLINLLLSSDHRTKVR